MELNTVLEGVAVTLALLYVVLAAKESIWCWLPAFLSSSIYVWLTWTAGLVGESAISVFYMAMAVYGWVNWTRSGQEVSIPIIEWKVHRHLALIAFGALGSIALGIGFQRILGSQMPYLDALTTVFSFIATFMVTRKILSNWLYWIAIDALNVFLYWNRDLELSAVLFLLYTVLAAWGYINWRKKWRPSKY